MEHILERFISNVNNKWYKNSWREFEELKHIDKKYYCSNFYDVDLNYYKVEVGTSLRFWESKGWINEIDPYGWFQWFLDIGGEEEMKMILINGKKFVSRFVCILNKLISKRKDSKKIRQILLHLCYELTLS